MQDLKPIERGLIASALLTIALLFLITIPYYPPPTCDETGYSSAAIALLQPDAVVPTIFPAGHPNQHGLNVLSYGRTLDPYELGLLGLFQVGGVSLFTARLFSWLGWLLTSFLTYLLGVRCCADRRVGLVAALLFATSTKAFLVAHLARPEAWTIAFVLLGILVTFTSLRAERNLTLAMLSSGILVVLPGTIHPNGFLFSFGIVAVVGIDLGLRRKQWSALFTFGVGLTIGIGVWLGLLYLAGTAPKDLLLQMQWVMEPLRRRSTGTSVRWLENLSTLPQWSVFVFWQAGGPLSLVEAGLGLLGLVWAFRNKSFVGRSLVGIALSSLLIFGMLNPNRWTQYGVLWSPFWYLAGIAGLFSLTKRLTDRTAPTEGRYARLGMTLAVIGLTGANLLGDLWLTYRHRDAEFRETGEAIAELVPPETHVLADPIWWWFLRTEGRTFMSDEYFLLMAPARWHVPIQKFLGLPERGPDGPADFTLDEATEVMFELLQPDYVVLDNALSCAVGPINALEQHVTIVTQQCDLVGRVRGAWVDDPSKSRSYQFAQVTTVYSCTKYFADP